jgi:hypothetical protein
MDIFNSYVCLPEGMADFWVVGLLRMRQLVVEEWYSEIMGFSKRIYNAVEIGCKGI